MRRPISDHLFRPGPIYWDWRCTVCWQPVDEHAWWGRVLWRKFRGRR